MKILAHNEGLFSVLGFSLFSLPTPTQVLGSPLNILKIKVHKGPAVLFLFLDIHLASHPDMQKCTHGAFFSWFVESVRCIKCKNKSYLSNTSKLSTGFASFSIWVAVHCTKAFHTCGILDYFTAVHSVFSIAIATITMWPSGYVHYLCSFVDSVYC